MFGQLPRQVGDFYVLQLLGEGGMGEVYLAKSSTGRRVALKMVRQDCEGDPEFLRRFRREVFITQRLRHPHIVETLDAGTLEGRLFMACAFIEGGTLEMLLRRLGQLPVTATMAMVIDLLSALEAIQAAGLIHRDVKPNNLLLEEGGSLRLTDLGLARPTSMGRSIYTKHGQFLGTLEYAAPEQLHAVEDLDIRCDLYAAGCVLFRCLAGRPPFTGEKEIDFVRGHLFEAPPDLRVLRAGIPDAVVDFTLRLLAKKREDRPLDPTEAIAEAKRAHAVAAAARIGAQTIGEIFAADPTLVAHAPVAPAPTSVLGAPSLGFTLVNTMPRELAVADDDRTYITYLRSPPVVVRPKSRTIVPSAMLVVTKDDLVWRFRLQAGDALAFGRKRSPGTTPQAVLAVMPLAEAAAKTGRISTRHFELSLNGDDAFITDLRSTGGTTLNKVRLEPGQPTPLSPRNEVDVAGVLNLVVRVLGFPGPESMRIEGIGAVDLSRPALVVERPDNGEDRLYGLIPGRFPLDERVDIVTAGGGLWLRGREDATLAEPLTAGFAFALDGTNYLVAGDAPEG